MAWHNADVVRRHNWSPLQSAGLGKAEQNKLGRAQEAEQTKAPPFIFLIYVKTW